MADQNFVHLHNHTEYSMLDGAQRLEPLFTEVARLGMPAVAQTDHGNMFGAYEFFETSTRFPVKPIIGIESYLAPSSRLSRKQEFWSTRSSSSGEGEDVEGGKDVSGGGRYTHMTMLAENADGLRNLFRLSSLASYEGYYLKPRMDRELISQYASGIIATTGCPSGEVQTRLRLGQYDKAVEAAASYRDIFGEGNFFLELMDHGLGIERAVRQDLLRLAKELGLPLLATNDSHYVHKEDADVHDNLLCVGVGRNKNDPKRFRFDGDGYYIKSPAEMREIWRELPEACDSTVLIAERVQDYSSVFQHVDRMPQFPVPAGETQESWFRKEVQRGLHERYPEGIPQDRQERADYEVAIILGKGYPSYFLVVADFINWAKAQGIRVGPGRGSGAGSVCAYALNITDLDPIKHGLLFERFLNPERPSMPDFDIDFDDRRRGEVIAYVVEKYGAEHTAMVNTFGKIKAKQAVKDSAKILGFPYSLGEKITKVLPPDHQGRSIKLGDMFDPQAERYAEAAEVRAMAEQDPEVMQVLEAAQGIESLIRQVGVHAAAVILSSEPLLDVIPMHRRNQDGALITGFDYPSCEALGLVKMDFLGLKNLTIVDDAIKAIEANRGVTIDLDDLTKQPDDAETYRLLAQGGTLGVFQVEGGGMRALLRLMRPNRFEDISAALALYRPGPMGANAHTNFALRKNGQQEITPIHRELEEPLHDILADTYSVICYQEQVQQIAQKVAGYTLGAADNLRRAMGKKKKEVLDAEYVPFEGGMLKNGYSRDAVKALWDILVPFSDYAFNRCSFGSTQVHLGSSGSDSNGVMTIEELYRRLHVNLLPPRRRGDPVEYEGPCLHCQREDRPAVWRGRCKACKSWWIKFRNSGLTALSMDTDGRIRPRRIKDVHYNGKREGFTVRLADGKEITATANHRHMTPNGWRRVDELAVGDSLLVVGDDAQKSYKKYDYRVSAGLRNHESGNDFFIGGKGEQAPGYVDGGWTALQEWTEAQEWVCSAPGCKRSRDAGDRIERAHLDGDRTNNSPENLKMLCASHHKQHDYEVNGRLRRWEVGKPAVPVKIVSIESAGVEDVYDLEMDAPEAGDSDGPERSWVGNGIITHNSHTAAYGMITYWTAYLKCHFPTEYMAALLTSVQDDKDKMALYLGECRRMKVKVLPPDVDESGSDFTAAGDDIRFGLTAIRNVGHNVVSVIREIREEGGPFASFEDFVRRVPATACNKRTIESLIKGGAFDSLGHPRQGLMAVYEAVIEAAAPDKKAAAVGQESLFDEPAPEHDVPNIEWDKRVLLAFEREMLGLYVSDHPLEGMGDQLAQFTNRQVVDIIGDEELVDRTEVALAGLLTSVVPKRTKKGDLMGIVTLEDLTGSIEVVVFPKTYAKVSHLLEQDSICWIGGRINIRDESVNVAADDVRPLDEHLSAG